MERDQMVAGLAAGDDRAWRLFLDGYGRLIYSVVRRFDLNDDERDDVFQNACVVIHRSVHTLRDPSKLSSWIYGVTYRLSIDALRKKKREILTDDPEPYGQPGRREDPGPAPDAHLQRVEEAARLYDLLELLDERCRRLLTALYLQDPPLSYKELGEEEGMPLGSIGPTRARCLEKLRRLFPEVSTPETAPTTDRTPGIAPRGEGEGKP